jgi:hypothetical protein
MTWRNIMMKSPEKSNKETELEFHWDLQGSTLLKSSFDPAKKRDLDEYFEYLQDINLTIKSDGLKPQLFAETFIL